MEIYNKTIEVLKKSDWYEGRKIDISENLKFLKERGFNVLDSAEKFMEEFGELKINVEEIEKDGSVSVDKHTTCTKEIVGCLSGMNFELDDYVNEKVMVIGGIYDLGLHLYISESGRIFETTGWIGDNAWEAFDNIINKKGFIGWDNFNE